MKIEIHTGDLAKQQLLGTALQLEWSHLHEQTDCTIPHLLPSFVVPWITGYQSQFDIFYVTGRDADNRLTAFLPLAHRDGVVSMVGSYQAEYQGWLCESEAHSKTFLSTALDLTGEFLPTSKFVARYVLPGHCVESIAAISGAGARVTEHTRPLMSLDLESLLSSMRKKGNKSKLNRLKRQGDLKLVRVRDAGGFDEYLEPLLEFYDLRQGGQNGVCPFLEDPHKLTFHRDWLLAAGDDLIVSVLTMDNRPISLFFGVVTGNTVANAIVAHDPRYAQSSVSKLHIYLFGEELANEGFQYLDMTPGGDPWKDRFASEYEPAFVFEYWQKPSDLKKIQRRDSVTTFAKKLLAAAGIEANQLRDGLRKLRRVSPGKVVSFLQPHVWQTVEYRIYRMESQKRDHDEATNTNSTAASINSAADLIRYQASSAEEKSSFLREAADRISHGESAYTIVQDDQLSHYGWIVPLQSKSFFTEVSFEYVYETPGAVLYDFFTHPNARGRGHYQSTLRQMIKDISGRDNAPAWIYISVLADNGPSRYVIEKAGFTYVERIVSARRLGKVTWTTEKSQVSS